MPQFKAPWRWGGGKAPGTPQPDQHRVELKGFGLEGPCCRVQVLLCPFPSSAPHPQLMPSTCGKWPGGIPLSLLHTWDPAPAGDPSSGRRDPSWGRSMVRAWGGLAGFRALGPPAVPPLTPFPSASQLSPAARAPGHRGAAQGTSLRFPSAAPSSPPRTSGPGTSSTTSPPPASKSHWSCCCPGLFLGCREGMGGGGQGTLVGACPVASALAGC